MLEILINLGFDGASISLDRNCLLF